MPQIFASVYHENVAISGLNYLALGIGLVISAQVNSRFMDRIYLYFKKRNNGVGQPEFRVREYPTTRYGSLNLDSHLIYHAASMLPGAIMCPIGLLLTGWAAEKHLHWAVTDVVSLSPEGCAFLVVHHTVLKRGSE